MRRVLGSVNILFQDLFASLVSIIADWRRCVRVSRLLCGVFLEASTSYFKIFSLPSFRSLPVGADVPESAAHYRGFSENVNASISRSFRFSPAAVSSHFWRWRLRGGRIMGGKNPFGKGLFEIILWVERIRRQHGLFGDLRARKHRCRPRGHDLQMALMAGRDIDKRLRMGLDTEFQ